MTFLSGPLPRIIAHRGLAIEAPENTLLAFLRALSAGATHLETDVHASSDGEAVISHDPDLTRVAGRPVRVEQLTMAQLRRIDLGHGQTFCSLAEALDAFPEARYNIDIKDARAALPAARAILQARATDRVLITSFDEKRRRAAADALPGVASSASVTRFLPAILAAKFGFAGLARRALCGLVAVQIPERRGPVRLVTPRTVRVLHDAGVEVHVWTVNDPAQMTRLLDIGVDGLVTDRCDVLKTLVTRRN
ncbi:glycerophosphodiester phosphodiesterase [Leifsonia poae]|uniref:glycerophosphodiester phosphodiesterase n=1 Tax=Leifsonia poae TaxID=110933 RepID=UPI003D667D16